MDQRLLDLLAQRDLDACVACWRLARELVAADPQIATFEALLEAAGSVLADLGEHGFANRQLPEADIRLMLADSAAAVKALRASGLDDGAAFEAINRGRVFAIGSRDWFEAEKLGVSWRSKARWLERVLAMARGEADDE